MLKIIQSPDKILFEKAKEVKKIDEKIINLVKEMSKSLESAKDPEGVGLAAPQIGKSLKIFITKPERNSNVLVYINPKISDKKTNKRKKPDESKLEGCLSVQDIWGVVDRSDSLILEYLNLDGEIKIEKFRGFKATIVQHEVDHLNGILFTSRVLEQNNKLYKSSKNEEGQTEFNEISV